MLHRFPGVWRMRNRRRLGCAGAVPAARRPLQGRQNVGGQYRQPSQAALAWKRPQGITLPASLLDYVVRRLNRSRLFPVPLQQLLGRPLPHIADDREMLHRAAIRKQLSLLLAPRKATYLNGSREVFPALLRKEIHLADSS